MASWGTVAAGGGHTVGLQADGTLWAWGDNYYGQLGDGTTVSKTSPEKIGVPAIVTQPLSHTTVTGTAVTFSVRVTGFKLLSYQWRKDGMNVTDGPQITGSTEADLTLSNVQLLDGGNYILIVSNTYGTVTSSNAVLTVMDLPPTITAHPQSRVLTAGASATFSVTATGSMPLLYQWRKDSVPLAGANHSSYTISNVLKNTEGDYCVVVNNLHGSVTSTVATLTVTDPAVLVQPASQKVEIGHSVTFSITTAGTPSLAYQWWKDGATLPEATRDSLTLTNLAAQDNGEYIVVVSNPLASITSSVASLTVTVPLGEALDAPHLTWTSGGSAVTTPWFGQLLITHDGADAAQSGTLPNYQGSGVQTTVTGPGSLSFYWKRSTTSYCPDLEFHTNGVEVAVVRERRDWRR